jgi:MoaA/NifB/PqqE/SkfB family radical SAM enzyme
LLRDDLVDLWELLRRHNKTVVINTNGELLRSKYHKLRTILNEYTIVGLSIDGPDKRTHTDMRGPASDFDEVLEAARCVSKSNARLKIGTVVAMKNYREICRMATLINDLKPAVWRLYRYADRSWQNDASSEYDLTDEEFNWAVSAAHSLAPGVMVRAADRREGRGCFIIDNRGYYLSPEERTYLRLGHVADISIDECFFRFWQDKGRIHINKRWLDVMVGPNGVQSPE